MQIDQAFESGEKSKKRQWLNYTHRLKMIFTLVTFQMQAQLTDLSPNEMSIDDRLCENKHLTVLICPIWITLITNTNTEQNRKYIFNHWETTELNNLL